MHELSIAGAIQETARRAAPPGAKVEAVQLRAGPMRGIEPQAMQWAWQAAVADTDFAGVKIELELLPWRLHCVACGRDFTHEDIFATCACGSSDVHPVGGDELQIVSLTIDDGSPALPAAKPGKGRRPSSEKAHESRSRRKRPETQR